MFAPINLSAYADSILNELVSGKVELDGTMFYEKIRQADGSVLEVGCGDGRLTIPLAERGIDMTGIELSTPTLAYAREKARDLPITWIEGDARSFELDKQFALIFARGDVLNFLLTRAEQEAMLARVYEHLGDDGLFMLDNVSIPPTDMVDALDEAEWYRLTDPQGRDLYVSGTDRYDHTRQLYVQTCYHRLDDADGELIAPPWELTLRYIMPMEMESLLHYNGFEIVERYQDWNGTPPSKEIPASVFVCRLQHHLG